MSEHERGGHRTSAREVRTKGIGWLATAVKLVCTVAAIILAAHVVLTVGGANPDNGITEFVGSWAQYLALGFQDLFTPEGERTRVLVNYGIAAIFWVVVGAVASGLLRRLP
ncbi:MAG: hypothetical protein GEV09_24170 [Pseudonocardiaceae bacterium]|nr:hypothetical protein [Pseudonocardiaceae bacterium]